MTPKSETCAKCEAQPTYRVEGYAECGWDGGFVFVYLCDNHYRKLSEYLAVEENEPWDGVYDLIGVEFVYEIRKLS